MTCLQVKRMTLPLTTILIIDSCHLGRGGGVTAGDASTSTTRDLKIASLFHHIWTDSAAPYKRRHLHNLYEPPPRYLSLSRGGGVSKAGQDTVNGAWCLGRAQCMIWVYLMYTRDAYYYRAHTGK